MESHDGDALAADTMLRHESTFLHHGPVTRPDTLAVIQLSKDDLVPVYLRDAPGEHDGYKEGHVLNTRFGSFPHSTLIGIPWGSQVRASNVDTGSRGRKKKPAQQQHHHDAPRDGRSDGDETTAQGLKRKRDMRDEGEARLKTKAGEPAAQDDARTSAVAADNGSQPARSHPASSSSTATSGFVHILPPTPEIWTSSLPHRTQVVYTPDYSYVLQRIRARPGSRLVEAGSGSGSFTHAAARAVYDGRRTGRVFSFEFHEQRFHKMRAELHEHRLGGLVTINHRDVYNEGFLVDGASPEVDAVFLDLPAPWLALPHLSRRKPKSGPGSEVAGVGGEQKWTSPLNPRKSVYICTFSPCIEQVTRTVSEMRKLGWVEIEMVEISHKRIQVFREKLGLDMVSDRNTQVAPKDVSEAIARLKEIEAKAAEHNAKMIASQGKKRDEDDDDDDGDHGKPRAKANGNGNARTDKRRTIEQEGKGCVNVVPSFMQGQLVTRPDTEIKAHTSYLVFAVLPREWSDQDEAAAAAKWPVGKELEQNKVIGTLDRAARKQAKRELLQGKAKRADQTTRKQAHHQPRTARQQQEEEEAAAAGKSEDVVMGEAKDEDAS